MKEILKHLVDSTVLPEDEYLDQDAEILEIFVDELEEIFETLQPLLNEWVQKPSQDEVLVTIRRNFHTLKGSGRMVGAKYSGELAWTVEDTLNRVIAKNVELSSNVLQYVMTVFNLYQYKLYPDFKNRREHSLDLRPLVLLGQQLQQNLSLEPTLEELLGLAISLNHEDSVTGLEIGTDVEDSQSSDLIAGEESFEFNFDAKTTQSDLETQETIIAEMPLVEHAPLSETMSIFIEESEEHVKTIESFLKLDHHSADQYNQLIRALHTLRGSSSMAQVNDIFESSSKVEEVFKSLVKSDTETSKNETVLLTTYVEYVQDYLYLIRINTNETERFVQVQQKFDQAWDLYDFQASHVEQLASGPDMLTQLMSLNIDILLDTELDFDQRAQNEYPAYFEELSQQAQQIIEHTDNRAALGIHQYSLALKSSYDSVLRNQNLLNTNYIFELFGRAHQEFIHLFDTLASGQRVGLSDDAKQTIDELSTYLQQDIDYVEAVKPALDVSANTASQFNILDLSFVATQLVADKQDIDSEEAIRAFDNDVLDIFIEEADEILVSIDEDLNTWSENLNDTTALNNLMRHLHTLKGGANMVQAEYIGLIAHELETIYERIINNQLETTEPLVVAIRLVQDDISDRMQIIREERTDYPANYTIALLQNIVQPQPGYVGMPSSVEVPAHTLHPEVLSKDTSTVVEEKQAIEPVVDLETDLLEFTSEPQASIISPSLSADVPDDSVEGIAQEIFAEEAEELIQEAKVLLPQWAEQRSNRSLLLQLQRIAHSLKGGAKMVQMEQVADIAYELETAFEQFALHNFNSNAYDSLLESAFNWIKGAVLEENFQYFTSLKTSLENIQYTDVSAQLPEKLTRADSLTDQYTVEIVQGDGTEPPSMMGELGADANAEQNDEMIRISADLIEKMIDLSGENAINRSRIEMDLSHLGNTLTDMELAIQRLADQLRRMDGELESQIIAKHGDLDGRYEDFDPLEMDQYSSINQLSKSLAESASDLVDFKSTLVEKIKDTEGILLQQSRIQAEISEGLMRARLVPFSRLLPRLQRLVRQVSTTLNKPTELLVNNTEGELDRTILEKLVSPLEHMLRNALDHGIETTTERLNIKKPAQGKIELDISRQGTDIVIEFKDDGRGIDAAKIRAKAIDLGLIKKDQTLTDEDVIQYIFHPGFSTAEKVTQISGRGVGLDVVQSGIKSLGGQVSVASKIGQGSVFTIRVPTTVAVSDALMVKVGDQQFAVPLAQIDRIVRISPAALEDFFGGNKDHFEIDNQSYKLRYLAEFVAHQAVPKLAGVAHSLPVLLIKGNMGNTIALLVDQLIGSRSQIVMKPIGEQFSSVAAVSGATILGDGQVCLILDGQSIARQVLASNREEIKIEQRVHARRNDHRQLVMIVDDSVTVRKVTTRLLERHGYDVITAKDGVDAIEQLENVKPDLMLLDIEMPRMDGFEVTNLVRHHEIHRELPIIMITSRTGEKHRERAFSLGVNNYMGKPFQEANLLENITAALQAGREA